MRTAIWLELACLLPLLAGCATGLTRSLHEYDVLDRPENLSGLKQRKISAFRTQDVTIATGNTQFADDAYQELINQCPRGRIVNVSMKSSTRNGFLAYQNGFRIDGTCLE